MPSDFDRAREFFADGVCAFEEGRFDAARGLFEASLSLLPGRASTLVNLGATQLQLGRPQAALEVLDAAVATEPSGVDAWSYRGAALGELGRHEEALACHERVLALAPGHEAAAFERALSLMTLQRHAAAREALETLLAARPRHGQAWVLHGQALQALEQPLLALRSYDHALALDAGDAQAWSQRGGILKDMGRPGEAAHCFGQALAHGGDAELNGYFLASVAGGAVPQTAPRLYVEQLFDGYADDFDQHVTRHLGYRAPEVLPALLPERLPSGRPWAAALDLGCGTGLLAPRLMPQCLALDGVDLSRRMLDKARELGLYRTLVHADLVDCLQTTGERYDLVVAADVFIYVGDLQPVFEGVMRVLRPGGTFAFCVEEAAASHDLQLRPSSRFAHSEGYLRGLAARHRLQVQRVHRDALRSDQRQPIGGLYVVLGRGADLADDPDLNRR